MVPPLLPPMAPTGMLTIPQTAQLMEDFSLQLHQAPGSIMGSEQKVMAPLILLLMAVMVMHLTHLQGMSMVDFLKPLLLEQGFITELEEMVMVPLLLLPMVTLVMLRILLQAVLMADILRFL